jgi:hypothetical protein
MVLVFSLIAHNQDVNPFACQHNSQYGSFLIASKQDTDPFTARTSTMASRY